MFFKTHELEATESGGSNLLLGRGTLPGGAPLGFQGDDFAGWGRTYQHRMDIPPVSHSELSGFGGLGSDASDIALYRQKLRTVRFYSVSNPALAQRMFAEAGKMFSTNPNLFSPYNDEFETARQSVEESFGAAEEARKQGVMAQAQSNSRPNSVAAAAAGGFYEGLQDGAGNIAKGNWFFGMNPTKGGSDFLSSATSWKNPLVLLGLGLAGAWLLSSGARFTRRNNTRRDRRSGKFVKKARGYKSKRSPKRSTRTGRFK